MKAKPLVFKELMLGVAVESVLAVAGFWIARALPDDTSQLIVTVATVILGVLIAGIMAILHLLRKRMRAAINYQAICESIHSMAHHLRDGIIRSGKLVPSYQVPAIREGELAPRPNQSLAKNQLLIAQLLADTVDLFEMVSPPGVKITAALRDVRADGGYHTFLRAGRSAPSRGATSKPLYKGRSTILTQLRRSYSESSCVVITGSNKGADWWERQFNDTYRDDMCVMMGVVMVRSWNETGFVANKHAWILCVNANREGAFTEADIPLMKACTDLFSAVANTIIREEPVPA